MHIQEKIRKFYTNPFFAYIFFGILAFTIIGRSLNFHFLTHYINGGDTVQSFNFMGYVRNSLHMWDHSSIGTLVPLSLEALIPNLILYGLSFVLHSHILAINIYWILLLFYLMSSHYLFFKIFLNKNHSFFATLTIPFTLFFLIFFHTPITFQLIGLATFPTLYYCLYKYLGTGNYKFVFIYAVSNFIAFRSLNIIFVANLLTIFLYYYLNSRSFTFREYFKKIVIVTSVTITLCVPYIINLIFYLLSSESSSLALNTYNQQALSINHLFDLQSVLNFSPNYGFLNRLTESPGWQSQSFSSLFNNPIFIFLSFIPLAVMLYSLTIRKFNKNIIVLLVFLLSLIFLAKGLNPPFSYINQILYSNKLFALFFRSGALYFLYLIIPLVILIIFKYANSRALLLLGIYIIANFLIMLVFYSPINNYWNTQLPSSYIDITKHINENDRYLVLPITDHFVGYTVYKDGYAGPDRLNQISNASFLTKSQATIIPSTYTAEIDDTANNAQLINSYDNLLHYQHLIIEKDAVSSSHFKVKDYRLYTSAIDNRKWKKTYENKDFIIYDSKTINSTDIEVSSTQNVYRTNPQQDSAYNEAFLNSVLTKNGYLVNNKQFKDTRTINALFEGSNNVTRLNDSLSSTIYGHSAEIYKNINQSNIVLTANNNNYEIQSDYINNIALNNNSLGFSTKDPDLLYKNIINSNSLYLMSDSILHKVAPNMVFNYGTNVYKSLQVYQAFDNQITNGSFEQGSWQKNVSDCDNYDNDPHISGGLSTLAATNGTHSLLLAAARHKACENTNFKVKQGLSALSFDYMSPNSSRAGYYIRFDDAKKTTYNAQLAIIQKNKWQNFSEALKVPAGAKSAQLYLYSYESNGKINNKVYYDNFSFSSLTPLSQQLSKKSLEAKYEKQSVNLHSGINKVEYQLNNTLPAFTNQIPNPSFESGLWNDKVDDCSAYNAGSNINMKLNNSGSAGNYSLQLSAQKHVACTSINFPLDRTGQYSFSFDYKGKNAQKAGYYISFDDTNNTFETKHLPLSSDNSSWHQFKENLTIPQGAKNVQLVLYAFDDNPGYNFTYYDNFVLAHQQDIEKSFFTVSGNSSMRTPDKISYSARMSNATLYKLNVRNTVSPFVVFLNQPYQSNWLLENLEGVSVNNHFIINNFQNGWYIDPVSYCKSYKNCIHNKDGSYDIQFTAKYNPQKYFQIGLYLSAIAFLISSLIIIRNHLLKRI